MFDTCFQLLLNLKSINVYYNTFGYTKKCLDFSYLLECRVCTSPEKDVVLIEYTCFLTAAEIDVGTASERSEHSTFIT